MQEPQLVPMLGCQTGLFPGSDVTNPRFRSHHNMEKGPSQTCQLWTIFIGLFEGFNSLFYLFVNLLFIYFKIVNIIFGIVAISNTWSDLKLNKLVINMLVVNDVLYQAMY